MVFVGFLKSNQENVKVSLYVRTVGEILALFSVKNILLEIFKYYRQWPMPIYIVVHDLYNTMDFYRTQVRS